ncbi:DUF6944 family repetitive protein [Sutcliffiella sp. NPDC057660]|uniref:DUF6944 family repetitive protein n=1 Tax=Sutcliffiella sp. NPDC057660 TaxID=3346199 RepID=UPI0036B7730E
MNDEKKILAGSWIQAIGTVLSAISSTRFLVRGEEESDGLDIVGNVLQATGNALEADGQEGFSYGRIGNGIQAVGNITVISGLVLPEEKIIRGKLFITGNLFQALGAATALGEEWEATDADAMAIIGNILQVIGNSLQAIGGAEEIRTGESENTDAVITTGSWIQAIGAVILALEITKEQTVDEKESKNKIPKEC